MIKKLLKRNFFLNFDLSPKTEISLKQTKNISQFNLNSFLKKKITVYKINEQLLKNFNEIQQEQSIQLFNIDPSQFIYKQSLLQNSAQSNLYGIQNGNNSFYNVIDIQQTFMNQQVLSYLLNQDQEEMPLQKLISKIKEEYFQMESNEMFDLIVNLLFDDKEICFGGMPETLLRSSICNIFTKKQLLESLKIFENEINKFDKDLIVKEPKQFFSDLLLSNYEVKLKFFRMNYIFEQVYYQIKKFEEDIHIYLEPLDFQYLYDINILKSFYNLPNIIYDDKEESKTFENESKNEKFKISFVNLFGKEIYQSYIKKEQKKQQIFFLESALQQFLSLNFSQLNKIKDLKNSSQTQKSNTIFKFAFFEVFFFPIIDNFYITNKFYFLQPTNLINKINKLEKIFFVNKQSFKLLKEKYTTKYEAQHQTKSKKTNQKAKSKFQLNLNLIQLYYLQ